MKTIKQTYKIKAPIEKVWEALVSPELINKWGGGPAKMSDKLEEFSLWGGDVHGKNIEVKENKLLKQEWFGGKWDKPSIMNFELSEKDGITTVDLFQTDVPDDEEKDIDSGWKNYYMEPLKKLVEK